MEGNLQVVYKSTTNRLYQSFYVTAIQMNDIALDGTLDGTLDFQNRFTKTDLSLFGQKMRNLQQNLQQHY